MKIGTTSFGFRYLLLDPARAPQVDELVERASGYGLELFQICENARPLDASPAQWSAALARAREAGITLGLGCKTTSFEVFRRYVERAESLEYRTLRIVFEEESGAPPTRDNVDRFLETAVPLCARAGLRLAIENHFDVPSAMLADAVRPYPAAVLGFCVDTANSLRNFEPPELVFDLLAPRAFCYHFKDYRVDGHLLGFQVGGTPLGEGRLPLDALLSRAIASNPEAEIYAECWVPASGDRERDIREDETWLRKSLAVLKGRLVSHR